MLPPHNSTQALSPGSRVILPDSSAASPQQRQAGRASALRETGVQAMGGGIILVIALFAGVFLGLRAGEPSIGLVAGLAVGLAGALGLNWWDARRRTRRR